MEEANAPQLIPNVSVERQEAATQHYATLPPPETRLVSVSRSLVDEFDAVAPSVSSDAVKISAFPRVDSYERQITYLEYINIFGATPRKK